MHQKESWNKTSLLLGLCFCIALFRAPGIYAAVATDQPSVAFYYGSAPPVAELSQYDQVIIDADAAATNAWQELIPNTDVFCYLSVGEIDASQLATVKNALGSKIILGQNEAWKSAVTDVTSAKWRDYLLQQAQSLTQAGCEGLFLDTLDSYQLAFAPEQWPQAQAGLVEIIQALKRTLPTTRLMLNRGFDIFAQVKGLVAGVTVESLYRGWDPETQTYRDVPAEDRAWLLAQLAQVQTAAVPITIIDYLPLGYSDSEALAVAKQISKHGFTPWVTDLSLYNLGTGFFQHHPRRVALLYSSSNGLLAQNDAHILLGAPLDHLGYVVEPFDINQGLPQLIRGVHAGMVTWLDVYDITKSAVTPAQLDKFLLDALAAGYPNAIFGGIPTTSVAYWEQLGLANYADGSARGPFPVLYSEPGIGDFEDPLREKEKVSQRLINTSSKNKVWLALGDGSVEMAATLVGPWGGVALNPLLMREGYNSQRRWILDPFRFLEAALKTKPAPVPDPTTENGLRILLSHVDGDAFPSRAEIPGSPYSAEVLLEQVFKVIDLPHTVSVIEGETGSSGLYPELSAELEDWARKIFALDNVEIASHSYSHPFFWARADQVDAENTLYGLGLPIKGYVRDLRREIIGSLDYINERLAPPGKKAKVFLWTGDAVPSAEAIGLTKEAGVWNLNGGNTAARGAFPSMTNVYGLSRPTAQGYQIYAPIMNENVYTNDWTGPYWGFRKAIESFEITESPRRLKPIDIYYHFYSGTKQSALNALLDLYDYVLAQPTTPMYISEYAARAQSYHHVQLTQRDSQTWTINQLGELRTVRIPATLGWPDLAASTNVAGVSNQDNGRFVHLTADHATLVLQEKPPTSTYLVDANGMLREFEPSAEGTKLRIEGHVPLRFSIHAKGRCRLTLANNKTVKPVARDQRLHRFELTMKDTGHALLVCR